MVNLRVGSDLTPKERVIRARIKLLREKPFFGYALMHVKLVPKGKERGVRGPKIVYSEGFVKSLDDEELMAVLAHELLHYLLGHVRRTKEMKKNVRADEYFYHRRNIADDIVVNAILVRNGFKLPRPRLIVDGYEIKVRAGAILPTKDYSSGRLVVRLVDSNGKKYEVWGPDEKSAEEVYWEIRDFVPEIGNDDEDTMYFSDDEGCDSCGDEGDGEESSMEVCECGTGGFLGKTPEELLSEAYMYARMQGKEPKGIERFVTEFLKPKVDWKTVLRRYVSQMIPYDYFYYKPSKKSPPNIFFPGIVKGEHLEALIGIDTSGSITQEELNQFFSEVKWIARMYPSINFTLVTCDAEVQTEDQIRSRYEIDRVKPKGGGGTDFRPVFELAAKKRVKLLIYFTDGCLLPGTLVLGNDSKKIEDFQRGDQVIASDGKLHSVISPTRRWFDGEIVTIKALGCLPITVTADHPIKTYKIYNKCTSRSGGRKRKIITCIQSPEWKLAKDIRPYRRITSFRTAGDWLIIPKLQQEFPDEYTLPIDTTYPLTRYGGKRHKRHPLTPKELENVQLTEDVAWFLGLYTAEGTANIKTGVSSITLNVSENELVERVQNILETNFGLKTKTYVDSNALRIIWVSKVLARFLHEHVGNGARNKRMPNFILFGNERYLRHYLRGYFDGDGCIIKANRYCNERLDAKTASEVLALQIQLAFARFGILASLSRLKPDKRYFGKEGRYINTGITYRITCSDSEAFKLLEYPLRKKTRNRYYIPTLEGLLVPVKQVSIGRYRGYVYNIEVAEDPTYLVSNVVVHNCGTFPEKAPRFTTIWVVPAQGVPESHFPFGKVVKMG